MTGQFKNDLRMTDIGYDVFHLSMANHKAVLLLFDQVYFVVYREVVESYIDICTFGYTRHSAINYSGSQGDEQM